VERNASWVLGTSTWVCWGEWIGTVPVGAGVMWSSLGMKRKPIWYLDSGCSRHMTGVKIYLHKYMEQPGPKIDEKRETIFNSNKEAVMVSPRVRDVYVLDMTSFAQKSCFFIKASENLNWLWNKRLAHLNFKTINRLAKQNLVIGVPSLVYSKDKPCSSCEKGKHHKASFKTKQTSSIKKLAKMKVIKEGFKKLGLLKINDDSFAYNTPLGTIFNEFSRLSGMDDDLFTYEVEIPGLPTIPCDKKEGLVRLMDITIEQWLDLMYGDHMKVDNKIKEGVVSKWLVRSYKTQFDEYMEIKKQWVTRGIDADMEYDPYDVEFAEWLASKFYNHKTMDRYTKNALWIYRTRGDDEVEIDDEEFSDPDDKNLIDKEEVAEIL
nr:retrovirus-related Pol polyprotein from transposon TNT 1-94 [Tanacetum cinerariifolium]